MKPKVEWVQEFGDGNKVVKSESFDTVDEADGYADGLRLFAIPVWVVT